MSRNNGVALDFTAVNTEETFISLVFCTWYVSRPAFHPPKIFICTKIPCDNNFYVHCFLLCTLECIVKMSAYCRNRWCCTKLVLQKCARKRIRDNKVVFKLRKKVLVKGSKMIIIIARTISLKWAFRIEDLCPLKKIIQLVGQVHHNSQHFPLLIGRNAIPQSSQRTDCSKFAYSVEAIQCKW